MVHVLGRLTYLLELPICIIIIWKYLINLMSYILKTMQ